MAFDPKNLSLVGPMSTRRHLPKELADAACEFATPVGEVMWAWNYCHSNFASLFCIIITPHNLAVGHAIWHSLQSDHIQRAQLISAARIVLSKNKPMLRRIEWAIRSADSLSTIRNDAAHVSTAFSTHLPVPIVVPSPSGTAPSRLRRLREHRDLQKRFETLRGDLIALSGYVALLSAEIAFPGHYTLPQRPILQCIPRQAPKKKRHYKNTRRPPPQRSSRA